MTKKSAGILLYRLTNGFLEVLIAHPGGPSWAKRDDGAWSIPKGEFTDDEAPLDAAIREFGEEVGAKIDGDFIPLAPVKQRNGKVVYGFALEGDFDMEKLNSNTFTTEWPPKSGLQQEFPEIDRVGWFDCKTAKCKLNERQATMVDELLVKIGN